MPGCVAVAPTLDEAVHEAKDGLALHLWGMEEDGKAIPQPTSLEEIEVKTGETLCLLDADMFAIRAKMNNRPVKKTLTIPWYLNELAEKQRINFSQLLQSALRERLSL